MPTFSGVRADHNVLPNRVCFQLQIFALRICHKKGASNAPVHLLSNKFLFSDEFVDNCRIFFVQAEIFEQANNAAVSADFAPDEKCVVNKFGRNANVF